MTVNFGPAPFNTRRRAPTIRSGVGVFWRSDVLSGDAPGLDFLKHY